jgi:DNA-binding NarL/FixJ family response regulator
MYRKAIRTVHSGELWLPHLLISQIIATCSTQGPPLSRKALIDLPDIIKTSLLTRRELCIIKLVAQGLTNKQIAKELAISPETIKKHLKNIFEKSGVHSRCQLASMFGTSANDNRA